MTICDAQVQIRATNAPRIRGRRAPNLIASGIGWETLNPANA
jgi:hypothetical protein